MMQQDIVKIALKTKTIVNVIQTQSSIAMSGHLINLLASLAARKKRPCNQYCEGKLF